MSDYFDSAQAQIDQRKKAALEALAAAGTEGKRAHEEEIARIQAARQQAITAALAGAAKRGAPAELNDQLSQQIGSGYDRQADNLRASLASRQAGGAALQGANGAYFDEAAAAVPAMRARADRQLEEIRAKAAQAEFDRQMQLQLREMQLRGADLDYNTAALKAQSDRDEREAKAQAHRSGADLSDSELRTRLMGAAAARTAAAPAKAQNLSVFGVKLPQLSQTGVARSAGLDAGLDKARVFGVTAPTPAKPAAAPRPSQQLADMNAQAEINARNARLKLLDTAKRAASSGTYLELGKAIDAGEAAPDAAAGLQAALDYVNTLKPDYLKRNRISKAALIDWVKRYAAI